jgi:hypothetical protein
VSGPGLLVRHVIDRADAVAVVALKWALSFSKYSGISHRSMQTGGFGPAWVSFGLTRRGWADGRSGVWRVKLVAAMRLGVTTEAEVAGSSATRRDWAGAG